MKHLNLQEVYDKEIFEAPALTIAEVRAASSITPDFEIPVSGDRMAQLGLK